MDFTLTPEQERIRDRARQFAREEVAPLAREADVAGSLSPHLIARLAELGFLAGPLDAAYGGAGMDSLSFALVCEELGWADSSLRGFLTVHAGLVTL